jgi:hypothetical protein
MASDQLFGDDANAVVFKVLFSAVFAGIIAVLVTRAVEKFGGAIGGVLATTPTTVIPASIGIYYQSRTTDEFRGAMFSIPIGLLINALFLYSWQRFPAWMPSRWSFHVRLTSMISSSLSLWLVAAVLLVLYLENVAASSAPLLYATGGMGMLLQLMLGLWITWIPPLAPKGSKPVSAKVLFCRSLLAATAIGFAVFLGTFSQFAAGVASCFPAVFLTSMVSLWMSQGEAVPAGAVGPMVLGSLSVSSFAALASITFPEVGPWIGLCILYPTVVLLISVPVFGYISWRRKITYPSNGNPPDGSVSEPLPQSPKSEANGLDTSSSSLSTVFGYSQRSIVCSRRR